MYVKLYCIMAFTCIVRSIRIIKRKYKEYSYLGRYEYQMWISVLCWFVSMIMYAWTLIIWLTAKVLTWLFYRLYIQKHHDQSLCVWPNQCHDVSYDLLFNDWRSGCNIINLFTLFELKFFKQNKVTIYAKLVFPITQWIRFSGK